jgi:5-methylcytosine-specific restriction protein B
MVIRWWVVANPKIWTWDQLFEEGHVQFRLGKLTRHFSHLNVGDVVVGYQSAGVRRLAALATVSKPFGMHDGPTESFELAPLLRLPQGPTYDDLRADPLLAVSEPIRNRNQGILFALSDAESERLLRLLTDSDSAVATWLTGTQRA